MLWRYTTKLRADGVHLPGRPHRRHRGHPVLHVSAIAQLTYLVSRRRRVQGWLLARDLSVAGASVLFSMWVTFASGYQVVYQALVVMLAGLVLYAFLNARRERLGETAEPVDNPAEQPAHRRDHSSRRATVDMTEQTGSDV